MEDMSRFYIAMFLIVGVPAGVYWFYKLLYDEDSPLFDNSTIRNRNSSIISPYTKNGVYEESI